MYVFQNERRTRQGPLVLIDASSHPSLCLCSAAHLDKYERSKIADALIDVTFQDGACIIAAGDRGNNIYFIREVRICVDTVMIAGSCTVLLLKSSNVI